VISRGGAFFNTGRNGLWVIDKSSPLAATYIMLTNGTAYAERGFYSKAKNGTGPVSITVGASPFTWTAFASGSGTNVFVFVDGTGCVGSISLNGTTIFQTLASQSATIPLQPGETVTVTYSVGTPVMTWKPF
jgi:hypothetical protein